MNPTDLRDAIALGAEVYAELSDETVVRLSESSGHAGATDEIGQHVAAVVSAAIARFGTLGTFWDVLADSANVGVPVYDVAAEIAGSINAGQFPEHSARVVMGMVQTESKALTTWAYAHIIHVSPIATP